MSKATLAGLALVDCPAADRSVKCLEAPWVGVKHFTTSGSWFRSRIDGSEGAPDASSVRLAR